MWGLRASERDEGQGREIVEELDEVSSLGEELEVHVSVGRCFFNFKDKCTI